MLPGWQIHIAQAHFNFAADHEITKTGQIIIFSFKFTKRIGQVVNGDHLIPTA